jgi:uncharacterized phage protein (TIGR01671 family)
MTKFRAWDKENGCWASIDSVALCDDGSVAYLLSADDDEPPYLEEDVEIMQYTGLDDVNGKPIYEGDIVKAYRTCKSDLITFANGSFGIAPDYWHSFESFTDFYGKCEVIGNKFQNPELLEVEK